MTVELILPQRYGRQTPTKGIYDDSLSSYLDNPIVKKSLTEWWGFSPLPWQELVLRNSLSIDKNGLFCYKNIGLSVPRQNGKSEDAEERLAVALTFIRQDCVYTSYRDTSSKIIFNRFLDRIERAKDEQTPLSDFFPKLPSRKAKDNIIESFNPRTGEKIAQVRFTTRKGGTGRGASESLIIIDEAQDITVGEHDALTAGIATFPNGQIWYVGTAEPAEADAQYGMASSKNNQSVFGSVRKEILNGLPNSAWFEWSTEKLVKKTDKDAWYECNPSLGFDMGNGRGLFEKELESVAGTDESFNIERLNYWSSQDRNSVIDITRWNDLSLTEEEIKQFNKNTSSICLSIKSDLGDKFVDLAIAVRKTNGDTYVSIRKSFDMNGPWVDKVWIEIEPYLSSFKCKSIIIDGKTAESQMRALLESRGKWRSNGNKFSQGKIKFTSTNDIILACALLTGSVNERTVFHGGQNSVNAAIADAGKRKIGSGYGFYSISNKTSSNSVEAIALALYESSKQRIISNLNEENSEFGSVSSFSSEVSSF